MPAAKLTPPNTAMSTRKPVEPSERCGVITAEKMAVSAKSLSAVMAANIPKAWRGRRRHGKA